MIEILLVALASRMKLTGVNQLWVADITYIDCSESLALSAERMLRR
jgi:hypothetical protein